MKISFSEFPSIEQEGSLCSVKNGKYEGTLPEAQRTQDIEFIIQIIFIAEIKQPSKQASEQTNKQDVLVYLIFIFAIFLKI